MWEASTTPDLLKRWLLGPPGWTMTACEMNLRVGGVYRSEWRKDDGTVMRMGGVLREVVKSGASTGMETGYARLAEPPAATQAGGGQ